MAQNNNEIDIYGILNANTVEGIIAKAEQISMPLFDGSREHLSDVIRKMIQIVDADYIVDYAASRTPISAMFFTLTENATYKKAHIYYYSGETLQVEDFTPEGTGGGSGGGDTGRPVLTVTTKIEEEYNLNDTIILNYYWSSSNTGTGRVYGIIDGVTQLSSRETPTAISGASSRSWKLPKLERGKHNIEMYVVDAANVSSSPRYTATIVVGGVDISTDFDDTAFYVANQDLVINYSIYNSSEFTARAVVKMDNNAEFIETNPSKITISGALMTPGYHTLTLRAETIQEVSGEYVVVKKSKDVIYNVIAAEEGVVYVTPYYNSTQDITGSASTVNIEANQSVNFRINIIEIGGSNYRVTYYLDTYDETFTNKKSRSQISQVTGLLGINSFTNTFFEGYYKLVASVISMTSGQTAECEFQLTIARSSLLTIDPITDGLQLWLDASGRTNSDENKDVWEDKSGNNTIVEMNDFNYSTNGWITNSDGYSENYLLINSRAYVKINYEPFIREITDGLTVDIEFETRDINNADARVISCYGGRGFFANTSVARLGSSATPTETTYTTKTVTDEGGTYDVTTKTGPFEIDFREGVKTHLTYVIFRNTTPNESYPIPLMAIYLNGILTGIKQISNEADKFITNAGQYIYLGCNPNISTGVLENFGECKIYNLRVYDRALTAKEIVTNYIYDIKDQDTQQEKIKANKLGAAASDTTKLIPEMTFSMFETDFNGIGKTTRKKALIDYTAPSGTTTAFSDFGTVQWQGTSTLAYAVKNYKIFIYSQNDFSNVPLKQIANSDGTITEEEYSVSEAQRMVFENPKEYGKKHKIDIGNGIKESKFTLKADYMDSGHWRNTGNAMMLADLGTEETPVQEFLPVCRTTIYGFPIRLYINKVPDNASINGIPDDTQGTKSSLGIYNFNLDKGCTDSLGLYEKDDLIGSLGETDAITFKAKYPYFDTISFEISANSDSTAGAFARNDYKSIIEDFEYRFPDEDDIEDTRYYGTYKITDGTIELLVTNKWKFNEDGTMRTTKFVSNNLISGTYTISGSLTDSSTVISSPELTMEWLSNGELFYDEIDEKGYATAATATFRCPNYIDYDPNTKEESSSPLDIRFYQTSDNGGYFLIHETTGQVYMNGRTHLKKLITWVMESTDDEFYNDFEKHFNLPSVLDYFTFVFTIGMVDNLGKNMMIDTYGPPAVGRTFSVGRNKDKLITYTEEEIARYDNYAWYIHFYDMDSCLSLDNSGNVRFDTDIEMTAGVYNTSKSVLWTKFQRLFYNEIRARYIELRENKTYTVENFMKYYYDKQISIIPEMDYNNDFYNKYLETQDRREYLYMMHGSQYEAIYKWIEQRLYFVDTFYEYGSEYEARCTVRVEYADYANEPITFKLQTYIPSYCFIIFKNSGSDGSGGISVRKKVGRGQTVEFSEYINTSTDQEIILYNAGNLKSFGDVSKYTPKTVLVDQAKKLTSLIVGTEEHPNPNLTTLSLGNNTYLTDVVIENCTAMSYSLNVSGCSNLERISTKGSSISSVTFPDGAPLKSITLSKSTTSLILKNLSVLDSLTLESTDKLTSLEITNCPKLTGYMKENGEYVEGPLWNKILTSYTPSDPLTTVKLEAYGYVQNYNFLDAVAKLANRYPQNFDISGHVRYLGTSIPQMYSYYKDDFPNLTVQYPNVNNVASMFENYKNINAVWSRDEQIGSDDNISIQTFYYWTDLREDDFPENAFRTYGGVKGRLIDFYDDQDMEVLADEIKERLAPFQKFTNVNSMFRNMRVLEYLHDDTFDNIDLTGASTTYMFDGCNTLKYLEIPRTLTALGSYMFGNCYKLIAYIPETISRIEESSFYTNNHEIGMHPMLLFESPLSWDGQAGIRDARYNIKRGDNGRALQTRSFDYTDPSDNHVEHLKIDYFDVNDNNGLQYIKDVYHENKSNIFITDFNMTKNNGYSNPFNALEFLPGSLKNCKNIAKISTPPFNVHVEESDESDPIKEFEVSIARMFNDDNILDSHRKSISFDTIYILSPTPNVTRVNRYFLMNTNPRHVYISSNMITIENSAFASCSADDIFITGAKTSQVALNSIGDKAYKGAGLTEIFIPDTVTYIGEEAFADCQKFTSLKYSKGMTYIPVKCFQNALKGDSGALMESIKGFSKNIREIGNQAFDGAVSLGIFKLSNKLDKETDFDCYFNTEENTENQENLEYFTNLERIGNYAFRNVHNISRINVKPTIKEIGAYAFYPPQSGGANETLLVWDKGADYSNLSIESAAFINRQFSWLCDTDGFTGHIIPKVVYIPEVKYISAEAFSPYSTSSAGAELDFVLTPRSPLQEVDSWTSNFVTNCLDIIYDFEDVVEESGEYSTFMYFLTNNGLNRKSLLARLSRDTGTVRIPSKITFKNNDYILTEILDKAFVDHDTQLNNIWFDEDCVIRRLGNRFFDGTNITNIFVVDENNQPITNNNKPVYIPASLVSDAEYPDPIGDNNPFKSTAWFSNNTVNIHDDFVYLNEYCIGYEPSQDNTINITSTQKTVRDDIKFIYENAFAGSQFRTFRFPSSLRKIFKGAYQNCSTLNQLDFSPCRDTLEYIGNEAFMADTSLLEVNYTRNISYVGASAFSNCSGLTSITFEEGMTLSSDSEPINPIADTNGYNTRITKVVIPKSMGEFFKQGGPGYSMFSKLANLTDLVVGGIAAYITNLPRTENVSDASDYYGNGEYCIDFSTVTMEDGVTTLAEYYPFAKYANRPIKIKTNKPYFYAPITAYQSDLTITNVNTEAYDSADILRVLLGFAIKPTGLNTLIAQRTFTNPATAAVFANITNQRIAFKTAERA